MIPPVPVQFTTCADAPPLEGQKRGNTPGQCGTCTKCGKVVKVAHDFDTGGEKTRIKEARNKVLAALRKHCEHGHAGGAPEHVDRLIPLGVELFVRHAADGKLYPASWNGGFVVWVGGAAALGAAVVVRPQCVEFTGNAEDFVRELNRKKYVRVQLAKPANELGGK